MKKIIIILGILMCFSLTGCTSTDSGSKDYDIHSHFIAIEGENDLYYYSTTHVVYIVFNEIAGYSGYEGFPVSEWPVTDPITDPAVSFCDEAARSRKFHF